MWFCFLLICFLPDVAPPSPADGPLWRLGPRFTGPSLWVSLLPATAWLSCLCAWSVVAHCLPSSLCLMATKAFGPVWGSFPSTPCFLCCWGAVCSLTLPPFFCLVLWCGVCSALAAPLSLLPLLDGRFLIGWCVLFVSSFAWIPRILPRTIARRFTLATLVSSFCD